MDCSRAPVTLISSACPWASTSRWGRTGTRSHRSRSSSLPEMAEVETIVRDLRPQLEGTTVLDAHVGQPGVLRYPDPPAFRRRIIGRRLERVGRHGKFMLVELDPAPTPRPAGDGPPQLEFLVIHLGMTGRLSLAEPESRPPPHTHLRLPLSSGAELRMRDYRRFGRGLLGSAADRAAKRALPRLGPEPATGSLPHPESWRRIGGLLSPPPLSPTPRPPPPPG